MAESSIHFITHCFIIKIFVRRHNLKRRRTVYSGTQTGGKQVHV